MGPSADSEAVGERHYVGQLAAHMKQFIDGDAEFPLAFAEVDQAMQDEPGGTDDRGSGDKPDAARMDPAVGANLQRGASTTDISSDSPADTAISPLSRTPPNRILPRNNPLVPSTGGTILLADYSRQENKLRIGTRVGVTDAVNYFEIFQDGIRSPNNGPVFLLPEALKKIQQSASERNVCLLNIRKVQQAVRANQNMNNLQIGEPIDWSKIIGPGHFIEKSPTCPAHGTYRYNKTAPLGSLAIPAQRAHPSSAVLNPVIPTLKGQKPEDFL
jgi:hypothetical protein